MVTLNNQRAIQAILIQETEAAFKELLSPIGKR